MSTQQGILLLRYCSTSITKQSLGYYIQDTIVCNYFKIINLVMNVHHALALIGFAGALFDAHGTSEILDVLFLAEVTNPFFYYKSLSEIFYIEKRKAVLINNIIFLCMFVYIRGWKTNVVMYYFLACPLSITWYRVVLALLSVISSFWVVRMLVVAYDTLIDADKIKRRSLKSRKVLVFFCRNNIGKFIFPGVIIFIMIRALQVKYNM